MVPGGSQRTFNLVTGNLQGPPKDPRGARMLPQAPLGSRSGISGSIPGASEQKTWIFKISPIPAPDPVRTENSSSGAGPREPVKTTNTPQPHPPLALPIRLYNKNLL